MASVGKTSVLDRFSPATREWFLGAFPAATGAQLGAWDAISTGAHALVVAPTGSGKTLAAFLWALDRLATAPAVAETKKRTRILYISPLKALGVDVERNLRAPLVGITQTARRLGVPVPDVTVGVRSGDTTSQDRRLLARLPPDILITTPESLYLMLTSAARETLVGVETVIIDEVHAVAATKRGAHLAVSLERLDDLLEKPAQRIGLSATVSPREEVARFLAGNAPCAIVAPAAQKKFDLRVVVPVDDMTELGTAPQREGSTAGDQPQGSIWPHVEEGIVDLILEHRSTIVFANSRRLAERLTGRLNEIADDRAAAASGSSGGLSSPPAGESKPSTEGAYRDTPDEQSGFDTRASRATQPAGMPGQSGTIAGSNGLLARAHHGSVSKEQRAVIEDDLKSGRLRCVVATSSLELGIDMGAVDLVVQVESPPSVASGLQRLGRAGHQVGETSRGVMFPKHRADLLHTAVAAERMLSGQIESIAVPANPLDILAQQTVAAVALEPVHIEEWWATVRRSAPFSALPRSAFEATLDLLSGLYPSDEFAELRPRIVWDRVSGELSGRPGAQRLAVTSGGTIPDRGLFGVFMVGSENEARPTGMRVGELDEEMVYESRVGDVFALGTTSWRIEDITHDRVLVSPAFGVPARAPFWHGDGLGRPVELGRAIGAFARALELGDGAISGSVRDASAGERPARRSQDIHARLSDIGLDTRAATNLQAFVKEQKAATGYVPSDKTLVVERFRDELGDWRVILHSPFGRPVHEPWALAVGARIRERLGVEGAAMASDDGIVVRIPDTDAEPPGASLFVFDNDELQQLVTSEVGGSALFASRFRECAARALLLPRYNPGKRSPLWQQRQRSAQLLDVARKYPSFPIVLETVREVLQDVYDLPALTAVTSEIERRDIRIVEVESESPSPFARSLLFGYVASFMYEGDSPLAERRAAALSLDPTLLSELLGRAELRELLDPAVMEQLGLELQRLVEERKAKGAEGIVDLLRLLGPLSVEEIEARLSGLSSPETGVSKPGDDGGFDTPHAATQPTLDTGASRPTRPAEVLETLKRSNRVLSVTVAGEPRWAIAEDAGRLRDALGTPVPIGVPVAFLEPVPDPLGDLVARYARTHVPFTTAEVAERFGLGSAVVLTALKRLASERRVLEGEFRPGASGTEWCDAEVLRRLRSRSLAALRHEVEPVDGPTFARFLPVWQHVGKQLRGVDGVAQVVDQLAGVALPASSWESLVLPARVRDYSPAMLDELMLTGEVLWAGDGDLPGNDGRVSLHLAGNAPVTLPLRGEEERTADEALVLEALAGGGAYFFRQLASAVGSTDDKALQQTLWDLVWAGLVTNDTFAPLRSYLGGKAKTTRTPRVRAYRGRMAVPNTGGPPSVGGRWSLLPVAAGDSTVRAKYLAEQLLERHGVVTRGAVMSEGVLGGFALAYKVLSGFEETGRARRGYFIEGLGAAQFATGATIDRLRGFSNDGVARREPTAVTLSATDPANPYGAALPWPQLEGHRPGRKAGGIVVLVDGELVLYLERGGKTALVFSDDEQQLALATVDLARVVRESLAKLRIDTVNGGFVIGTPFGDALIAAGFAINPQGLRLHA